MPASSFKNVAAAPEVSLAWLVDPSAEWDNPGNPDRWKHERILSQASWTYDYMRKTGSKRALNASSGGQDSGYNITIDYLAIVLPMYQLGVEYVCDDLDVPYKAQVMSAYETGGMKAAVKEFMDHYLIAYYLPTNNNSDDHEKGARTLMKGGVDEASGEPFEGLGGQFHVRSIQDLVTMSAMVFGIEDTSAMPMERRMALMLELSGFVHASPRENPPEKMQAWADRLRAQYPEIQALTSVALPGHSIAYENFQARLRTVLIWAAANVHGGSPRANPNLSEALTNNTTAAGDLQGGGFNPNGGLFKDDEQELLKYLETVGIPGIVPPIRALHVINGNEPTAGLLPREKGEVVQTDVGTMQATMPQISAMGRLMLNTRTEDEYGSRELNFGEVYRAAKEKPQFKGLSENALFNTVANFYRRWYSGQFKIHMGTIQDTFGENVDHQTSRRTPNISGQSKDEIVQLAIDLLYEWAMEDGLDWDQETYTFFRARAWQDPAFVKDFFSGMQNREQTNMTYNLRGLYERLKTGGWEKTFKPPKVNRPVIVIHRASLEAE